MMDIGGYELVIVCFNILRDPLIRDSQNSDCLPLRVSICECIRMCECVCVCVRARARARAAVPEV